jgi:hypothetical protein
MAAYSVVRSSFSSISRFTASKSVLFFFIVWKCSSFCSKITGGRPREHTRLFGSYPIRHVSFFCVCMNVAEKSAYFVLLLFY